MELTEMNIGDKYFMELWDSTWQLINKTKIEGGYRLQFMKDNGEKIVQITNSEFEGKLIK